MSMEFHPLGASGLKVPPLGLGSWISLADPASDPPERVVAAALDAGITLLDTADVYDTGEAERLLGKAIRGRTRHHLVIATKAFWPMSDDPNDRGLSRKHLTGSVDRSLQRLGTDYVDLFQCHRYDPEVPLLETVATMGDLIRRGKILYWGTSMWTGAQLREACALCDRLQVPRPISEQARYNLLCREVEAEVVPAARELGVGFLWWSPLAQGVLSGKYRFGEAPTAATRGGSPRRFGGFLDQALADRRVHERVGRLAAVAAEAGVPLDALAISWTFRREPGSTALVGVRTVAQLERNLAALEVAWDDALTEAVEQAVAGEPLGL